MTTLSPSLNRIQFPSRNMCENTPNHTTTPTENPLGSNMNEDSHDLFSALWGDRPALQENWIKYKLFPPPNPQVISATSSAHTLLKDIQLVLNPIVGQHIWQHEEFELTVQADGTLEGCTKFGDNIEDEWFIVHLLLVATQTFPGLVGHVEDNDGQFLCIESALHLPSWMTPQNSSNRIFLYNGTVHVISPDTCRNLDDDPQSNICHVNCGPGCL